MSDMPLEVLRFFQYLILMLLFGLPLLHWYGRQHALAAEGPPAIGIATASRGFLLACALAGLAIGAAELVLKTMAIMGFALHELDRPALTWYVADTLAGRAWLVRTGVLVVIASLLVARPVQRQIPWRSVCLLAAVVLASLVWNGHAAASEGWAGVFRLVIGAVHLLAAAAWLGAIVGFLVLLTTQWKDRRDAAVLSQLHAVLHAFVVPGGVFVATLVVTGVIHYAWISEWQWSPSTMLETPYGRWMLFKLLLFACMLGLAAAHRWRLVPALQQYTDPDVDADPIARLRRSLRLEALSAVLIVMAVAVLGTMSPRG